MRTLQEVSPGIKTVYQTQISPLTKFAKVASVVTPLASQTDSSVTFAAAPAAGALVEIFYGVDIVLPPAVRTASGNGPLLPTPPLDKGLTLFLSVSAVSGSLPTLDCKVQQLDAVSNLWVDTPGAVFSQISGVVNVALTIFQGAATQAGVSLNGIVRTPYRVVPPRV